MRQLLFAFIFLFSISIISCSDNSTGSNSNNGNGGGDNEETTNYTVSIDVSPSDAGSISPSAEDSYEEGEEIELQANPTEGYVFNNWTGDVDTTSNNPLALTVEQDYEITANFELAKYELTVDTEGEGTVSINPEQTEYEYGTEVELTANTPDNWTFQKWSGDITEEENPVTITIDSDKSITAVFFNTFFAGGNGTKDNPFQISNLEQLQAINDYPEAHFIQINNIDASETKSWNENKGFKPIGDDVIEFKGSFNGKNYKILNLYIERRDQYTGLFGYLNNAILKNIILEDVDIFGSTYTGGLAGQTIDSNIKNSSISGVVSGSNYTGCLIGRHIDGMVTSSYTECTVDGSYTGTGGLLGQNRGEVRESHARVEIVNSVDEVGGLVGQNSGNIFSSFASGNVAGQNSVGGLAGENRGQISDSYSVGSVSGRNNGAGGLVGSNNFSGVIINTYSHSSVTGSESVGGLVGINETDIKTSYSTGEVNGDIDIGGLVGTNGGNISSSYWDTESTTQNNAIGRGSSDGTSNLTTSEMTGSSAENNMPDFDWGEIWITTDSYPVLFWE